MPLYRLTPPGELIRADSARAEGIHTVFRGMTHVIGKPREVVIRRVPSSVSVEVVDDPAAEQNVRAVPLLEGTLPACAGQAYN